MIEPAGAGKRALREQRREVAFAGSSQTFHASYNITVGLN